MGNLTVFLMIFGLMVPAAQADTQSESHKHNSLKESKPLPASIQIRGVVVTVEPNAERITIADHLTGDKRLFLANKGELINVHPGDNVSMTAPGGIASRVSIKRE
jgi:hypothetical protein